MAKSTTTENHTLCCWDFSDKAGACYHTWRESWFETGELEGRT